MALASLLMLSVVSGPPRFLLTQHALAEAKGKAHLPIRFQCLASGHGQWVPAPDQIEQPHTSSAAALHPAYYALSPSLLRHRGEDGVIHLANERTL